VEKDRIVLDSGALSALALKDEAVRVALRKATILDIELVVPATVIVESTTGDPARDVAVNRVLKATWVEPLDESLARAAGDLRFRQRARRPGAVDATVVATADRIPGTTILTSDPTDLRPLVEERRRSRIIAI
jgi:predicted nucleic acid-binding protein